MDRAESLTSILTIECRYEENHEAYAVAEPQGYKIYTTASTGTKNEKERQTNTAETACL